MVDFICINRLSREESEEIENYKQNLKNLARTTLRFRVQLITEYAGRDLLTDYV